MKFYLRIFSKRMYEGAEFYLKDYARYAVFEVSNV